MDARGSESSSAQRPDYESTPLTRQEYISAVVHLYRGELARADSWRMRLDNTTNWAILSCVGLLSFAFGEESHSHWVLLLGLALVSAFWVFEARRFRLYCVWRARVRMIEENFYAPILQRDTISPMQDWGMLVAEDLFRPRFKITRATALRARLIRNYLALFALLILAWGFKVALHPWPASGWEGLRRNLGESFLLPWWTAPALISAFVATLLLIVFAGPRDAQEESLYWRTQHKHLSGVD